MKHSQSNEMYICPGPEFEGTFVVQVSDLVMGAYSESYISEVFRRHLIGTCGPDQPCPRWGCLVENHLPRLSTDYNAETGLTMVLFTDHAMSRPCIFFEGE